MADAAAIGPDNAAGSVAGIDAATDKRGHRGLFLATILLGSFLLFLVQPMIARMALPRLGGAPAVWNSAMLVYQSLLLGGYAYAHWLGGRSPRVQAITHIVLFALAAIWLPVGLIADNPPVNGSIILWVPWLLFASIGPLFFMVASQAPLMQRWFSLTGGSNPYPLYAASNLGSFGGLICYPLLVEPMMGSAQQSLLWSGIYAALFLLVGLCALTLYRSQAAVTQAAAMVTDMDQSEPHPTWGRMLHWIILAAVPSGLMLSTTTHLTTDIMAMPLLWVIPLGLYLLSFSVAFAENRFWPDLLTRIAPWTLILFGSFALLSDSTGGMTAVIAAIALLFIVAIALHGEMYRLRPGVQHLTLFYLMMSVGGALGGVLCALIAPIVFDWAYEHPLLVLACAALLPAKSLFNMDAKRLARVRWIIVMLGGLIAWRAHYSWTGEMTLMHFIPIAILFLLGLATIGSRLHFTLILLAIMIAYGGGRTLELSASDARVRSYFGVYTMREGDAGYGPYRTLAHGTTTHGVQLLKPEMLREPTTYYGRDSGVGRAMAAAPAIFGASARIGVVGLGTGTLACYKQPGQSWQFFEIDPAMVTLARDSGKFTFLKNCAPEAPIRIGDARLTLAAQPKDSFDVLAIDAFSSDAIPMHMITAEAFATFDHVVQPSGLLLVHISNRFIDLEPVLASEAQKRGWSAMLRYDSFGQGEGNETQVTPSVWVAFSKDPKALAAMNAKAPDWQPLKADKGFGGWTDDYGSVLPLLEYFRKD
jgi:hypothetical protein